MDSIDKQIHKKRINMVFNNQFGSIAISLLLSTLFYSQFYQSEIFWVHAWFIGHIITILFRITFIVFMKKSARPKEAGIKQLNNFESFYSFLVAATCFFWGLTPNIFMPIMEVDYIPVSFALLFGVLIGGISRTDNSIKLSCAYIFGFLFPFISYGFIYVSSANVLLVVFSAIFMGFLFVSLKRQYAQYLKTARLIEDNKSMALDLKLLLDVEKDLQKEKALNFHNAKLVSIGELASGVAHEINNPLTIASGYIMALKNKFGKSIPEEARLRLLKVENALDRISIIIRNLKNLSRNEVGKSKIFSLSDSLNDTINFVHEIYENAKIELQVDITEDIYLDGRSGEIQQVVLNLLSNSKDALEKIKHQKIIKLSLYDNGDVTIIQVEDNGSGIPDNIKKNIFDPFFTTKDVNKGTGIGLSISHSIIRDHHGRIEIESETNRFTRFTISLPRAQKKSNVA